MHVSFECAVNCLRDVAAQAGHFSSHDPYPDAQNVLDWMNNARFALELWYLSLVHGYSSKDDVRAVITNLIPAPSPGGAGGTASPVKL